MVPKYPPQLSVSEAIRIIKAMYNQHSSREVSVDLMPEILNISKGSSYFPAAIVALQKFGLVTRRPNDVIELTDLAMQIINPFGDEEIQAKITIFKSDDVLNLMVDKYPNGRLPSEEQLKQTLMKTFNIQREYVKKWFQFVIESFKEFPKPTDAQTIVQNKQEQASPQLSSSKNEITNSPLTDLQNFEMPSGKKFYFQLDGGFSFEDLEFITDFFEMKKKWAKK